MSKSIRKIGVVALFALLAAFLLPLQALAATSITVDGAQYTRASGDENGTWFWDGANALTLDGYSGGGITAMGNLDITLSGKNTIDSGVSVDGSGVFGIYVNRGDLSIIGDGSLDVAIDDESTAEKDVGGIQVYKGDISIADTTVNASSGGDGIHAYCGDINIAGSKVSATSTDRGTALGASDTVSGKGNITIVGSDITAAATGTNGAAIWASSGSDAHSAPILTIVNSNVTVTAADKVAIVVIGAYSEYPGAIIMAEGAITSPEGAGVVDIVDTSSDSYGQTISMGTDTVPWIYDEDINPNSAIAPSVTITASSSADTSTATYRTLDQIKSDGTIRIGVYGDGEVQQSFDEAVAARIASDLGVKVETTPLKTDERIAALQDGTVDLLIANLSVTDARAEQVDFATDYAFADTAILSSSDNIITSEDQIADGRKIGVLKGTVAESLLKTLYPGVNLVEIDSYDAILDGTVDALADDQAQLLIWAGSHPGYFINVASPAYDLDISPAVAKGNDTLLAAIDDEIDALNTEQFFSETFGTTIAPEVDSDALSARTCLRDAHLEDTVIADFNMKDGTFSSDDGAITMIVKDGIPTITILTDPDLTSDQTFADYNSITVKAAIYRTLDQIKSEGTIKIGVYGDSDVRQSFDEAIAARIASDLGVKVETVPLKTDERVAALTSGDVDLLIANLSVTDERATLVDFATSYSYALTSVLTSTDNVITSEDQLAGMNIGVLKGTTAETLLAERYPDMKITEVDSYDAILDGTVDAVAGDQSQLLIWASSHPGYFNNVVFPSDSLEIAPAVTKGNDTLLAAIDDEIDKLNEEQFFTATFNDIIAPTVDSSLFTAETCLIDSSPAGASVYDGAAFADGTYSSDDGAITITVKDGMVDISIINDPNFTGEQRGKDVSEALAKATK